MLRSVEKYDLDVEKKKVFLQFKFMRHLTQHELRKPDETNCDSTMLPINFMRVHHFFSSTNDIDEMLKKTLVEIKLTEGASFDHAIFSGKSLLFSDFFPTYLSCNTLLLRKSIYLFSSNRLYNVALKVHFIE